MPFGFVSPGCFIEKARADCLEIRERPLFCFPLYTNAPEYAIILSAPVLTAVIRDHARAKSIYD